MFGPMSFFFFFSPSACNKITVGGKAVHAAGLSSRISGQSGSVGAVFSVGDWRGLIDPCQSKWAASGVKDPTCLVRLRAAYAALLNHVHRTYC
ncbi:hypothetical protein F4860DRAFT_265722 [Xylaria cubensis]|nr:hypothetical protein F4860DRAFT_265722 [Xylaria cubensis]